MTALRSGEYPQTINQLGKISEFNGEKCYCCEGVAVERYASQLEGWSSSWDDRDLVLIDADGNDGSDYAEDSFWEALALNTHLDNGTSTVFAFIMPEGQEVLDSGAEAASYMALNDDGFTFVQIADLIEWQFLSCNRVVD